MQRRHLLIAGGAGLGLAAAAVLARRRGGAGDDDGELVGDATGDPRIALALRPPRQPPPPPGLSPLALGRDRDGVLFTPAALVPGRPARLVIAFHGAGGRGDRTIRHWQAAAERRGWLVLAPDARAHTWDAVGAEHYGADVRFLEAAVAAVADRVALDPAALVLAGFSDGASYALGLGLANGDQVAAIVAMSPGGIPGHARAGRPRVFLAHGRGDEVLPFAGCGEPIARALAGDGYPVTFVPFAGGHHLDPAVVEQAAGWIDGVG